MSTTSNREESAAGTGSEPRPELAPERSGGIEGGTILVGVILVAGLVLMALKLAGVLG